MLVSLLFSSSLALNALMDCPENALGQTLSGSFSLSGCDRSSPAGEEELIQ
jgi:hypothetical protein